MGMAFRRLIVIAVITLPLAAGCSYAQTAGYLVLVKVIPLPGVTGRIDHMSVDLSGGRLFVAALANGTLEIIDLRSASVVRSIGGLEEPQGVYFSPESNKLYVTNGASGRLDVFNGTSFQLLRHIDLGSDADNVHADARSRQLLVSAGDAISLLDMTDDTPIAEIALPGHPEGFALEQHDQKVFVNIPSPSRAVFVLDRADKELTARWSLGGPHAKVFFNFPMALNEAHRRLFVGTWLPASLRVLDTSSGNLIADLHINRDADDLFYDSLRHRIYVSCGEGFVDVFQQIDPDHYVPMARVPTGPGARTSLWVPDLNLLFVAIPNRGRHTAEIRVFKAR